ncbi:hypothetical protein ACFQGT_16660 [Natrialbaceae archaeon GCM10025810]|uniref:hypothetical protein n=1 Tax=Halovalidus salilacus TaxID=3075124 RepID=UPI00361BB631
MSDSAPDDVTSGGERTGESGIRLWLLIRVNRWVLTAAILVGIYVAFVGASILPLAQFRTVVQNQYAVEYLFSAFIGAIITGTSIVVTINQLVLSQELGAVGSQRERMTGAMEFREDVESDIVDEDVAPPEPAAFLWELVDGVEEQADRLQSTVASDHDADLVDEVDSYVDDLVDNARSVKDDLENAQFGTFDVIWNALRFNYSRKIYDGRTIRAEYDDELSKEAAEAVDDTVRALKYFGPAREHFKTLYFQWELINLSRALLYIAVPALVVVGVFVSYVNSSVVAGSTLGVDNLVLVAGAGFVVGLAPFVVFTVYILRIATVAKRTLAMGPFILRETQREEDLG